MKFFGAIALLTLILSGQNFSQVTGLGNTDPRVFTMYKLPETTARQFTVSGSTRLTSIRQSGQYMTGENSFYDLNLQPSYMYLKENDDRVFYFNGYMSGGLHFSNTEHKNNAFNSANSKGQDQNISIYARPSLLMYTSSESKLFYGLSADAEIDMRNMKTKESSADETERLIASGYKRQNYSAEAGIGWGRLRNVTPVVNAIRFQERLKVLNKINSDLSEDDILALSQQFSRFDDYTSLFDRPGKYFYKDLDNVLSSRNISLSDMNLYSAAYLMETLQEVRFIRNVGFITRLNFMLNYDNIYNMSEYQPNPRNSTLSEYLTAGLHFNTEYSHQLDLYSQFSVRLDVSGGPNVLANPEIRQAYYASFNPAYSRELTDRFTFTASNWTAFNLKNSTAEYSSLINEFELRFYYFIEDNVSLNAEYTWAYQESNYNNNNLPVQNPNKVKNIGSTHSIWLGVTYALQNSLNLF